MNQKVGLWTLVAPALNNPLRITCRCECGTIRDVLVKHLKERRTNSCGCQKVAAHRRVMGSFFEKKGGKRGR